MVKPIGLIPILATVLSTPAWAAPAPAAAPSPEHAAFFESKVRPLLVEHCFKCHSAKSEKLKGGLHVDSLAGLLKGGDTGPALVPGDPEKSRLIESVRYKNDEMQMPPKGKLPDAAIKDLEAWVKMGAPWPGDAGSAPVAHKGPDYEKLKREHWAYQPLKVVEPPAAKDAAWNGGAIDRFVLVKLAEKGLAPSTEADRATLIRRLYFDLTGLPPTPEEIDAFAADRSPDAYEKLVDRLLASPHFGERWGRHWLDVARYADSLTLRGFVLKDAWRYRDYVIDQFNADRPFDAFMQEQVAGDLMPAATPEDRRRQLSGTTFLALGNTNLEEQDKRMLRMDVVDEQLDTIGKAFLGQTIGCARCHDHKFDPISTTEYYALAGILRNTKTLEHANVSKWMEVPLPADPAREAELQRHEAAVAAMEAQVGEAKALLGRAERAAKPKKGAAATAGGVPLDEFPGFVVDDTKAQRAGEWKVVRSDIAIGGDYAHDLNLDKGNKSITFQPAANELPKAGKYEVFLAYTPGPNRATNVPVTVFGADGDKLVEVNEQLKPPLGGHWVSLGQATFERNGNGYVTVSNEGTKGHVIVDAVLFVPVDELPEFHAAVKAREPAVATATTKPTTAPAVTQADLKRLEAELKKLKDSGPKRETVVSVLEEKQVADAQVHVRGSVQNLGAVVPRGFLSAVPVKNPPAVAKDQSGRRELGLWLAAKDNPLPARVTANRVWHWLIGQGIVRTVDNFGTTGESPSHPELLDFLAADLARHNWSIKYLVRQVVLSRTYRQAYAADPAKVAADPENRLCWRANRERLDGESIRDAMMLVAGTLDQTMGGPASKIPAADYGYKHTDARRSVYAPVFRNSMLEIVEAFDAADPSMTTGRRNASTVAPQALFMMNHPFVQEQARAAAAKLLADAPADDTARTDLAYRRTLGRLPTAGERAIVSGYLGSAADGKTKDAQLEAWAAVMHGLFASVEFRYVQ
ncbi:MAG TPA: DUF1553 domain-containing protein [Humisphaera sp.]